MSKFKRTKDYHDVKGSEPSSALEVDHHVQADYRVITGVGFRMNPGNITTLVVTALRLNPDTGILEGPPLDLKTGSDANHVLEAQIGAIEAQGSENIVLGGLGARAEPGNITTMRLWTRDIGDDGRLGNLNEWRFGSAPHNQLEVQAIVPDPYVIVSVGLRANPGNVTTLKGYFGRLVA